MMQLPPKNKCNLQPSDTSLHFAADCTIPCRSFLRHFNSILRIPSPASSCVGFFVEHSAFDIRGIFHP